MKNTALHLEAPDLRTRDRVMALLSQGAATAGEIGAELGLSPAAIRRHLDAMLAEGLVTERDRVSRGPRGRGRPAKMFMLTEAAREGYGKHTYDDLATAALRWIAQQGEQAVAAFAAAQVAALERRCEAAVREAGDDLSPGRRHWRPR